MKNFIWVFMAFSTLIGCKPGEKKTEESTSSEQKQSVAELPQLTPEQQAEGWKLLFDGKTLDGWRFYKNRENNSWEVKDGMLHCKPFEEADKRSDIMTEEQFDNFELVFDWKISSQGNSGVIFRVTEEYDEPYFSGPEYQILDDGGYPGEVKDVNFTGGNYDMHAPVNKKLNPVGEWNSSKLVVNGPHIEHWLNGEKVVAYEIGSDDWRKRREASKWKDVPGYALSTKGHLDFQDHAHEVWFKNIMIKPL